MFAKQVSGRANEDQGGQWLLQFQARRGSPPMPAALPSTLSYPSVLTPPPLPPYPWQS